MRRGDAIIRTAGRAAPKCSESHRVCPRLSHRRLVDACFFGKIAWRIVRRLGLGRFRSRRVNYGLDFGDAIRRKSSQPGMLANQAFARGDIDAINLVTSHIALNPLHLGTEAAEYRT